MSDEDQFEDDEQVPEGVAIFPEIPDTLGVNPLLLAVIHSIVFLAGSDAEIVNPSAADEAVQAWQALDAQRRAAWKLAEPLQRTLFVAGLQALGKGQYEQAVDKFREAGKAGLREKSLGSLIHYALVKAGQQLLDEKDAG